MKIPKTLLSATMLISYIAGSVLMTMLKSNEIYSEIATVVLMLYIQLY